MKRTILKLTNIGVSLAQRKILRNISLDIEKGDVVAIIGPSGSGKTTLLKTMNLILMPTTGSIAFEQERVFEATQYESKGVLQSLQSRFTRARGDIQKSRHVCYVQLKDYRRKFGMVFQDFNLWPNYTLFDNIAAPLKWSARKPRGEIKRRVSESAELVQIGDILNRYPEQVSGGQRQRAAIARALVMNPVVLLLDEITSALDPELVSGILNIIERLQQQGHTMVLVTHHMAFAKQIANKVVFLVSGEIQDFGCTEEIFSRSENEVLREFLGRFNSF